MNASLPANHAANSQQTAPHVVDATASADEWDAFVADHPDGTVDHLWGWRAIFEDVFGQRAVYLTARQDGLLTGVLPLVFFK